MRVEKTDFIVIGSGLAGLTSALTLSKQGKVLLLTKKKLSDCATSLAQGGIAAVVEPTDSFSSHIEDTLIAGAYHNRPEAVEFLVRHGPQAIHWLEEQGIVFDQSFGREAAHSHARILHATDFTGWQIEQALLKRVKGDPSTSLRTRKREKRIIIWENAFVVDLVVEDGICIGVSLIKDGKVLTVFSRAVILATGGLGQLYQWTTNPSVATGDGVAIAYRAGAKIADLEFIQFHPTALAIDESPLFLLSEALRGDGAYLVDKNGKRFMKDFDTRGELAPRDIVARAIFEKQKEGDVYIDIRHKGEKFLKKRFPNIFQNLKTRGFDLSCDRIPVTPAAHYSCGGVVVDLFGRTSIKNLFAFGEVACTGVHGANRLASNSLLEAVVFPLRLDPTAGPVVSSSPVSARLLKYGNVSGSTDVGRSVWSSSLRAAGAPPSRHPPSINYHSNREQIQKLMWEKVGIVRTKEGLTQALTAIHVLQKGLRGVKGVSGEILEYKNMLTAAELITKAALKRKKSLGAHFVY